MKNYTDEEIWASLEKKMMPILKDSMGLTYCLKDNMGLAYCYSQTTNPDGIHINITKAVPSYYEEAVKAAIVSAYRSGYGRAMKGRSFLLGEKIEREVFEKDGVKYIAVDDEIKDGDLCVFLAKENTHPNYYPAYGTFIVATYCKLFGEMWFNNRCYDGYIEDIKKVIPLEC